MSERKPNKYYQPKTYNTGTGASYNQPGKGTTPGRGDGGMKPTTPKPNKDSHGKGGGSSY